MNKIYYFHNFKTNDKYHLSEFNQMVDVDYLRKQNALGYNIYITVNTFTGEKRIKQDLAEIKSCFIDIDFSEIVDFWDDEEWKKKRTHFLNQKYKDEILPNIKKIEKEYWITPSQVNVTYKGLHIFYEYEEDCYYIEEKIHQKINNLLINSLSWDTNAKDVARVHKVIWYEDWKWWRKWKIRSLKIYSVEPEWVIKRISKENIKNNFNLKYEERDKTKIKSKVDKENLMQGRKIDNINKINELDSIEVIAKLVKYFDTTTKFTPEELIKIKNKLKFKEDGTNKDYTRFKFFEEDGINVTAGLFLMQYKNEIATIEDYSKKSRIGNYYYIENWLLKGLNKDYSVFNEVIYVASGMTLNSKDSTNSRIDRKIFLDFLNSRLFLPYQKENKKVLNIISDFDYPEGFSKVFLWFFHYFYENTKDKKLLYDIEQKVFHIEVNQLLKETFNIHTKASLEHNKKTFFEIIEIIKDIEIELDEKLPNSKIKVFKDIKKIKISNKDFLFIQSNSNNIFCKFSKQPPIFFNKSILSFQKGFKSSRITDLIIFIHWFLLTSKNILTYKIEDIYNFLGFQRLDEKSKKTSLQKYLKQAQKNGFIKDFKIDKTSIKFYKYTKKSVEN